MHFLVQYYIQCDLLFLCSEKCFSIRGNDKLVKLVNNVIE